MKPLRDEGQRAGSDRDEMLAEIDRLRAELQALRTALVEWEAVDDAQIDLETLTIVGGGNEILLALIPNDLTEWGLASVVHQAPLEGTDLTMCCQRSPFDLLRTDRMTIIPSLVTCGLPEEKP